MSNLQEDIKEFEERLDKIRVEAIGIRETSKFLHGIHFHPLMKLIGLKENELNLGHTLLHKCYVDKKPNIPKGWVIPLHTKFMEEFKRRGKNHFNFDRLDTYKDNI